MLQQYFKDISQHFLASVKQKVYDTNNWKSASASGHGRVLICPVCHRLTFTSALGVKFQPSERLLVNEKSVEFRS